MSKSYNGARTQSLAAIAAFGAAVVCLGVGPALGSDASRISAETSSARDLETSAGYLIAGHPVRGMSEPPKWQGGHTRLAQNSPPPTAIPETDPDFAYAMTKIKPWKSAHCDAPRLDYPRWEKFPVTLCDYTDIGVTVRTYMLNADKGQQARWTVTACRDAKATNVRACIDYMVAVASEASSSGVFPIAGYIPEPQGGGICYVFRDGVTVWTTLRPKWQSPKNKSCGTVDETEAPLHTAWKFARISSTTRKDYTSAGGKQPVNGLKWVDAARKLYQAAWGSDRNELMSAKAKAAKRSRAF